MTREDSLALCGQLAERIARTAPRVDYTPEDVKRYMSSLTPEDREALRQGGFLGEDEELYYVLTSFFAGTNVLENADPRLLSFFYRNGRRLSREDFLTNPYLRTIRIRGRQIGPYRLCKARYERGEILQYDMPDLMGDPVVLKLGFFTDAVEFPGIYEGAIPWMSVCPSEIASMEPCISAASGRALVLGLGLGYYPFMISLRDEVQEITIVERQEEILRLFKEEILPQFPRRDKIRLVKADAFEYVAGLAPGQYDFCFADIWENQFDGAPAYRRLRKEAQRLSSTRFSYWIEDALRAQLASGSK